MSKYVRVGSVRRFDEVRPDRKQVREVVEGAGRVYADWERWRDGADGPDAARLWQGLVDECADFIQATLNLVAALGVEDFRPFMDACEKRNRERGRITDGVTDE